MQNLLKDSESPRGRRKQSECISVEHELFKKINNLKFYSILLLIPADRGSGGQCGIMVQSMAPTEMEAYLLKAEGLTNALFNSNPDIAEESETTCSKHRLSLLDSEKFHALVEANNSLLFELISKEDEHIALECINDGIAFMIDCDYQSPDGSTFLIQAVKKRRPVLVKALIGTTPAHLLNCGDHKGRTALHYAVASERLDTVFELLRAKADVNSQDYKGNSPLHVAAARGNVSLFLSLACHSGDLRLTNKLNLGPLCAFESELQLKAVLQALGDSHKVCLEDTLREKRVVGQRLRYYDRVLGPEVKPQQKARLANTKSQWAEVKRNGQFVEAANRTITLPQLSLICVDEEETKDVLLSQMVEHFGPLDITQLQILLAELLLFEAHSIRDIELEDILVTSDGVLEIIKRNSRKVKEPGLQALRSRLSSIISFASTGTNQEPGESSGRRTESTQAKGGEWIASLIQYLREQWIPSDGGRKEGLLKDIDWEVVDKKQYKMYPLSILKIAFKTIPSPSRRKYSEMRSADTFELTPKSAIDN